MGESIRFYRVGDAYGEFSNFSPHPIRIGNREWPTSEHYFQAQKFAGTPHEEELRLVKDVGRLAKLGRQRSRPLRADAPHRGDGSGANMLGRILMEVRSELRA